MNEVAINQKQDSLNSREITNINWVRTECTFIICPLHRPHAWDLETEIGLQYM